jgi:hypothetical protein
MPDHTTLSRRGQLLDVAIPNITAVRFATAANNSSVGRGATPSLFWSVALLPPSISD